jgi:hypothetical protein
MPAADEPTNGTRSDDARGTFADATSPRGFDA